ncbi:flagellin [Gammaproteobacteria bacterium 45_16_T64]|nr:flagellin [Gammaproteobacteria bacterium 45_16_T64]
MPTINTNLASLSGLNTLNRSQQKLTESLIKLSTGSKINSAKDDAAGFAIAERFTSQINGLNVATRNANDGISYAQTAEAALGEATTALQRIRDLSVQAANGTNTSSDRASIQKEVDQLVSQVNQIADTTTFNGKKVLGDEFSNFNFQIGANSGQSLSVGGFDGQTSALGSQPGVIQSRSDKVQLENTVTGSQGIQEGNATANGIADFTVAVDGVAAVDQVNIADEAFGGAIATVQNTADLTDTNNANYGSGSAKSIAERINSVRSEGEESLQGVYASATTTFDASDVVNADYSGTVDTATASNVAAGNLANGDLNINGVDIGPVVVGENDSSGSLVDAINAKSGTTGVTASVDDGGQLSLTAEDGRDIVINTKDADVSNQLFGGGEARFDAGFSDLRVSGQVTVSAQDSLTFSGADNGLAGFDDLAVDGAQDNVQAVGTVANADVSTVSGANATISSIDDALSQIGQYRSELGALQNRFESTIRNLQSVSESQEAARSRIQDTDYASEAAELAKNLLKKQAGIAIQAQANAQSQGILSLLS